MSTTTTDEQLGDARRRIDRLQAFLHIGVGADSLRVARHLDALRREEASVLAAAREAPDEVDEKLGRLKARLAVAENSLAADVSRRWTAFAAAVEDELRNWDAYLERLQTSVAAKTWKAREQTEVAIGDVRSSRIEVNQRLAQEGNAAGDAADEARKRVATARDELERKADELSAKLD